MPQGVSADVIATQSNYSRRDVDAYATESHRRAQRAVDAGWFDRSIVPVQDVNGMVVLDRDERYRPGNDLESLADLKPSFA